MKAQHAAEVDKLAAASDSIKSHAAEVAALIKDNLSMTTQHAAGISKLTNCLSTLKTEHTAVINNLTAVHDALRSQHAAEVDRLGEVAQASAPQHATELAQLTSNMDSLKAEVRRLQRFSKSANLKLEEAADQHKVNLAEVHQRGDAARSNLAKHLNEVKQAAAQAQQQAAQDLQTLTEDKHQAQVSLQDVCTQLASMTRQHEALKLAIEQPHGRPQTASDALRQSESRLGLTKKALAVLTAEHSTIKGALASADANLMAMIAERDATVASQESAVAALTRLRQQSKTELKDALRALEEIFGQGQASSQPSQAASQVDVHTIVLLVFLKLTHMHLLDCSSTHRSGTITTVVHELNRTAY